MLYITTRNDDNTFTSHKALVEDHAPDGGRFVPFRMPLYAADEIAGFKDKPFNQTVAEILNVFFSARLTGWDIDFCIGRNAVRLLSMSHRIVVSELWHNAEAKFSYLVDCLYRKMRNTEDALSAVDWAATAVRIAVLFGIYGQMLRCEYLDTDQAFDVSVPAEDFLMPMAVFYARQMGLPVSMIISTCEENGNIWDFIHRGVVNTNAVSENLISGLEKLVHATLGYSEVHGFRQACQSGQVYALSEEYLPVMNQAFFCAVAGKSRAGATINSLFRSNSYVIDPVTALCYGGLQDYRAKSGSSRVTVLFAERTPLDFSKEISEATGIPAMSLVDHVKL